MKIPIKFLMSLMLFVKFSSLSSQDFSISPGTGFEGNYSCTEHPSWIVLNNPKHRSFIWMYRKSVPTGEWTNWIAIRRSDTNSYNKISELFILRTDLVNVNHQFKVILLDSNPAQESNILEKYIPGKNGGNISYEIISACKTGVDTISLSASNNLGTLNWEYQTEVWNGSTHDISEWNRITNSNSNSVKFPLVVFGPANQPYSTHYRFRSYSVNSNCVAYSNETPLIRANTQDYSQVIYYELTANKALVQDSENLYTAYICEGDSITLTGNHIANINSFYLWSNGNQTKSIIVTEPGTYYFHATWTRAGCERYESDKRIRVVLKSNPKPNITYSSTCLNGNVFLSTPQPYHLYYWSNGAQSRSTYATSTGSYYLEVIHSNGCINKSETIDIKPVEVISNFPVLPVKTYGNSSFTLSATVPSGLTVSYSSSNPAVATVSGNTVAIVGAGTTTIKASQAGCPSNNVSQILTVNKAALMATPTNASRTYGATNPTFSINYTGFVNGETASVIDTQPTATSAATALSNSGSYPINLTGGSDNNYTISNQAGTLTVTKKDLTATAVSTSKYMGQPNPPFSINYSGFVNGENSSVLDVKPVATTTATTGSPIGSYPINVSGGTDNNYTYTYMDGVLSVLAAPTCSLYISSTGDLCSQGRVTLRANITNGSPVSYAWSTGASSNRINVYWSDYYSVTVTFSNGCTATETYYVEPPSGSNCIYYLKADPKPEILNTSLFPNPVDNELTIELADDIVNTNKKPIPVTLFDAMGRTAIVANIVNGEKRIILNTKDLTAGIYLIQIGSEKVGIVRKKVLVVH